MTHQELSNIVNAKWMHYSWKAITRLLKDVTIESNPSAVQYIQVELDDGSRWAIFNGQDQCSMVEIFTTEYV